MMRCGENNHNVNDVHDGYEEEMDPSSEVNDTDKNESKNSIVHPTVYHKNMYVQWKELYNMYNPKSLSRDHILEFLF